MIVYFQIKDRILSANDRLLFAKNCLFSANDLILSGKIVYFRRNEFMLHFPCSKFSEVLMKLGLVGKSND